MARFRYSMQSILNIKTKMETQAKQEFSAASAALREEEERLQALYDRKAAYEREAEALLSGILRIRDIEDNKRAILCMEDYIVGQKKRITIAERNLELARERLTEVMRERKTHETLKDKDFEQFLAEEKRREGKEVDELTSYTYGQRRKEEAGIGYGE
ncbi:MAG: flagellar export protein FliJ [Roseburia sp.]|nr:flagellar export protein FliJ [Roseburia sp.]MCM1096969.1 flagellar export protein FliJ [Ruminococcus flavefaciens]